MSAHERCWWSRGGSRSFIGWLDAVQGGVASGWACDPDAPAVTIDVHLSVGGPTGSGAPGFVAVLRFAADRRDDWASFVTPGFWMHWKEKVTRGSPR